MRFLHTADWHLGKLFGQRYMTEDQRHVLKELIALSVDEGVQAVVIAGDIYDRAVPPAEAVELFSETLAKLSETGIAVLYIAGNHDSASRLDFGRELLTASGVYVRALTQAEAAPVVLEDAAGPVAFSLLPFATPTDVRQAFQVPREEPLSYDGAMERQVRAALSAVPRGCRSVADDVLLGAAALRRRHGPSAAGALPPVLLHGARPSARTAARGRGEHPLRRLAA